MVLLTTCRSPRDVDSYLSPGEGVGPGTYDGHRWGDGDVVGICAALDQQQRPSIARWHTKSVTPGPGAYDSATGDSCKTNPASSLRSQVKRISKDNFKEPLLVPGSSEYGTSTIVDNPGPGHYELDREAQSPGEAREHRPPVVVAQTPASFPPLRSPQDARYSGLGEDTLGPGDYVYDGHRAMKTVIRKSASAVDFHMLTSQREPLFTKQSSIENVHGYAFNPTAPGFYELRTKLVKGTSRPFSSKELRASTAQPFKSKSCSTALTPGPGAYPSNENAQGLDQHFQRPASSPPDADEKGSFAGVRSKVKRDGIFRPALEMPYTDSDNRFVPGPGYYPKGVSAIKRAKTQRARSVAVGLDKKYLAVHAPHQQTALRDSEGMMLNGFASTESRDCLVPGKQDRTAEPATYDRGASTGQSMMANLREQMKISKQGAFGSTKDGDRFFGFPLAGREEGPAPGDHNISGSESKVDASGGAFRSGGGRLSPAVSKPPSPGPGEYFGSKSASPSRWRRPRTDRLSFGSCQSRFASVKEVTNTCPGPGEYEPGRAGGRHVGGAARSTAKRELEPGLLHSATAKVGPGQYEVGGTMAELSVKTFNRTAESAGAELRQAAAS